MAEEVATSKKIITLDECKNHTSDKDCWLVVSGKVYDVTEFLDEHPGGYDIIVSNSGKDSTEDFDEIGHSKAAVEMLDKYYVGEFAGGDSTAKKPSKPVAPVGASSQSSMASSLFKAILPLLILLLAFAVVQQNSRAAI